MGLGREDDWDFMAAVIANEADRSTATVSGISAPGSRMTAVSAAGRPSKLPRTGTDTAMVPSVMIPGRVTYPSPRAWASTALKFSSSLPADARTFSWYSLD